MAPLAPLPGRHCTDHGSLTWLMRVKDPTGRLARWALRLQQYDLEIIHRPGTANGNADALSRRSYSESKSDSGESQSEISLPVVSIDHPCPPAQTLYDLQRKDSDLLINTKVRKLNGLLEEELAINGFDIIDNGNIQYSNLWKDGLHVNEGGIRKLSGNLSRYIKYC